MFASAYPEPRSITKGIGEELFLCCTVTVDNSPGCLHLSESLLRFCVCCVGRIPSGVQSSHLGDLSAEEHRQEAAASVVLHDVCHPIGSQSQSTVHFRFSDGCGLI